MTTLIATLGFGKGTWVEVASIIDAEEWDSIFIITNSFGAEKFTHQKKLEIILITDDMNLENMTTTIVTPLKNNIKDTEVALSIISGTGKEHLAAIAALMKSGLGIRFVTFENNTLKII